MGERRARSVLMHLAGVGLQAAEDEASPPVTLSERARAALKAKENTAQRSGLRKCGGDTGIGLERYFSARRSSGTLRIAKG